MLSFINCLHPSGFLVHGSVAIVSLALCIWWIKKDALMSFRSWSFFMFITHTLYIILTCSNVRDTFGITMADIFFLRGVEMFTTFFVMIRLYFIIEAHGIKMSEQKCALTSPLEMIANSIKKAITTPEDPEEINKQCKKRRKKQNKNKKKLLSLLF